MKAKTFVQIVKESTCYVCNQIDLKESEGTIYVWSINKDSSVFFGTPIVCIAESLNIGCYIKYNSKENRCELVVNCER